MKHRAGQAKQRLGSAMIFLAWAPERSPAPLPLRRAGLRHDRPLTRAQRIAARLLKTQGPKHLRLRLRHRRRPRLRSATGRRYAVSITHSDGLVLVAWAAGFGIRLGVDCERDRRNPKARLAKRLPWKDGQGPYGKLTGNWTALEAALKADGRGLSGLGRLRATANPWRLTRTAPGTGTVRLAPVHRGPAGFVLTLALGRDRP
jgi:phosphopantetheinyl transferase